eukprot:2885444-Amphidinium_carterae.1
MQTACNIVNGILERQTHMNLHPECNVPLPMEKDNIGLTLACRTGNGQSPPPKQWSKVRENPNQPVPVNCTKAELPIPRTNFVWELWGTF